MVLTFFSLMIGKMEFSMFISYVSILFVKSFAHFPGQLFIIVLLIYRSSLRILDMSSLSVTCITSSSCLLSELCGDLNTKQHSTKQKGIKRINMLKG